VGSLTCGVARLCRERLKASGTCAGGIPALQGILEKELPYLCSALSVSEMKSGDMSKD